MVPLAQRAPCPLNPALDLDDQFDLDRRDRAHNVSGAFVVDGRAEPTCRGRWILLIDDVVTTGATLTACAKALGAAGALGVSAITVARER